MPRIRLLLPALALLAVLALAPAAPAATTTVTTDADAWTNSAAPNQNYGSTTIMRANGTAKRPFIRFTVPALDGPVQQAVLRFDAQMGAPGGLRVYSTAAGWSEATLTHANAPALGALVATVPGFSSPSWREVDVTSAVTGSGARSFAITAPNATGDIFLTSRQGRAAAALVITTGTATGQAPASTSPPTVSGTAQEGSTLSASQGTWTGTAPVAYAYQWRRCDVAGTSCVDIGGATGTGYALASADVGRTIRVRVTGSNSSGASSAESAQTAVVSAASGGGDGPTPGTVINTTRSWQCTGALSSFGQLPIKVVSSIPNPGTADAIRLIGCYGDGNPATVDLILDVRGNGGNLGTGYDAVKVGQNAHDLVITGSADCGARSGSIHQDGVQVMSGRAIEFRDFVSGDPDGGRWTCWGTGGGFFISHVNGDVPTDVVCVRCRIAAFNQALRIGNSVRSGARDSVFGYSRSYGIYVGADASSPVNVGNRAVRY
jgi:hypothetical protein